MFEFVFQHLETGFFKTLRSSLQKSPHGLMFTMTIPCAQWLYNALFLPYVAEACRKQSNVNTSSTAQGGGGSFKNRKPIGEVGCCESGMAKRIHWWTERCLRSPLCLSLSLTIYLPIYLLCIYLSIYLAIYLSLSLFHLITYLPIYLSISLSFICLAVYLSIYRSIYLSVCLSICLPVYLWCSVIQCIVV